MYLFCLQVEAVTFEKSTLHLTLFPFTHWYSLLCKAKSSGQAYKGSLLFVNLSLFHSSFSVILSVCFSFHFVFSYFILISLPLILTLWVSFFLHFLSSVHGLFVYHFAYLCKCFFFHTPERLFALLLIIEANHKNLMANIGHERTAILFGWSFAIMWMS